MNKYLVDFNLIYPHFAKFQLEIFARSFTQAYNSHYHKCRMFVEENLSNLGKAYILDTVSISEVNQSSNEKF
jgi:hypothetical protein